MSSGENYGDDDGILILSGDDDEAWRSDDATVPGMMIWPSRVVTMEDVWKRNEYDACSAMMKWNENRYRDMTWLYSRYDAEQPSAAEGVTVPENWWPALRYWLWNRLQSSNGGVMVEASARAEEEPWWTGRTNQWWRDGDGMRKRLMPDRGNWTMPADDDSEMKNRAVPTLWAGVWRNELNSWWRVKYREIMVLLFIEHWKIQAEEIEEQTNWTVFRRWYRYLMETNRYYWRKSGDVRQTVEAVMMPLSKPLIEYVDERWWAGDWWCWKVWYWCGTNRWWRWCRYSVELGSWWNWPEPDSIAEPLSRLEALTGGDDGEGSGVVKLTFWLWRCSIINIIIIEQWWRYWPVKWWPMMMTEVMTKAQWPVLLFLPLMETPFRWWRRRVEVMTDTRYDDQWQWWCGDCYCWWSDRVRWYWWWLWR